MFSDIRMFVDLTAETAFTSGYGGEPPFPFAISRRILRRSDEVGRHFSRNHRAAALFRLPLLCPSLSCLMWQLICPVTPPRLAPA